MKVRRASQPPATSSRTSSGVRHPRSTTSAFGAAARNRLRLGSVSATVEQILIEATLGYFARRPSRIKRKKPLLEQSATCAYDRSHNSGVFSIHIETSGCLWRDAVFRDFGWRMGP